MNKDRIENNVLTVSEIAKKVGVSRNKVWSFIRRNEIKPVEKKNKVFRFDSSVVLEMKEKQQKKQRKNSYSDVNNAVSDSVLEILKKQLQDKQETIRNQQKQIEKQQETIDYFKNENIALRLDNSKKVKLLEDNQKKQDAVSENDLKTAKKQGFWSKIFGKK